MSISKRTEAVVACGSADLCWFAGIALSVFVGPPYGNALFWIFGCVGLLCLIHGGCLWSEQRGLSRSDPEGRLSLATLLRSTALVGLVYLVVAAVGTPLWVFAAFLARHRGF